MNIHSHSPYVRKLLELIAAVKPLMAPNILSNDDNTQEILASIFDYSSMRQGFIDMIAPDKKLCLTNGELQLPDRQAVWSVVNEILINEDYFFQSANTAPYIIDLGANFGLSLYYFKLIYPEAEIEAFEPDPDIFRILQANVKRNNWNKITCHNKAISNTTKTCCFYQNTEKTLAGSLTKRRVGKEQTNSIDVECAPLSNYIHKRVDYLKIDIEGEEDKVIEEISPKLHRVDHIFCEYHHGDSLAKDRLFKIIEILEKADFDYQIAPSRHRIYTARPMNDIGTPYSTCIWARQRKPT